MLTEVSKVPIATPNMAPSLSEGPSMLCYYSNLTGLLVGIKHIQVDCVL